MANAVIPMLVFTIVAVALGAISVTNSNADFVPRAFLTVFAAAAWTLAVSIANRLILVGERLMPLLRFCGYLAALSLVLGVMFMGMIGVGP